MDTVLAEIITRWSLLAVLAALCILRYRPPTITGAHCTAMVTLPEALPDGSPANAERQREAGPEPVLLIVDDEHPVRELSRRMAGRIGYTVLTAADGMEAVDVFRRHTRAVSCVILDVHMPRLDGSATFRVLRDIRPEVPIILCSGQCERETAEQLVGQRPSGFLAKPFSFAQFREAVQRAVAGDQQSGSLWTPQR
jgi:CheY-like chemotaxis protein